MNKLILFLLLLSSALLTAQNVVINEFMASNSITAVDPDGEFDDWIELYNNSDSDIELNGWYLSDEIDMPDKWTFPAISIAAGEFMIIWADNDEEQGDIHANFKLSASGEDIILSDASLNTIDHVSFGTQTTDISMGRYPDFAGDFCQMLPSFMLPNTDDYFPEGDLSEQLFASNIVQKFDLQFYTENWEDSLEYNYNNGETYLPAMLTYNDTIILDSIGVRYKGNSSYMQSSTTPKKPLKLHFGKYIDDQLLCGVEKLNFSNCVKDPSFMREVLAYDIIGKYIPSPRTAFANVYVDGEILGFYVQVEQVDEIFLNRHYDETIGNLYKAGDDGAAMLYRGDLSSDYEDEFELKTNEDADDWDDLISLIENLNSSSDEDFYETMDNYLDFESCAAMLAFNMVLSHFDSYTGSSRNYYLYHNPVTDKFEILPWDLNESFGSYSNNWDVISQDILNISNLDERPLNKRFLENETLKNTYFSYIENMITTTASADSITQKIAVLQNLIDPYVLNDPNKLYTYQYFIQNIDNDINIGMGSLIPGLNAFSEQRNISLMQQLSYISVYPGDCDNNGVVDEYDLLPIGLYFLQEGNQRDEISFLWQSNLTSPYDNLAATYADANGDGIVDENDVIGIGVNWNNTYDLAGISQEINLEDPESLQLHRTAFEMLNNALSGNSESTLKMKSLLTSIFQFENEAQPVTQYLKNFPNPFNPSTKISFSVTDASQPTLLNIYNVKGNKVITLINAYLPVSENEIIWSGEDLNGITCASGIYFCKLTNGTESKTNKLVLLK